MNITIRREQKEDHTAVYLVNTSAFEQENEAKLVDLLRKSNAFVPELSLVATVGGRIVGHILFTKIEIIGEDGRSHDSLALAPMAVAPDYQKQGIGGKLIQAGLEASRTLGYRSVIVLGHEHYYPKFGFVSTERWQIKSPYNVPSEAFMGIELVQNGLRGIAGTVKYPTEFDSV